MRTEVLRRMIHPEVRVLDAKGGLVSYVASDQTVDSYREIIRADGWRFDDFAKNAPFVDSHDYSSVDKLLGKVIEFGVQGERLVETVKWAVEVPDNKLAQLGFAMTTGGYLQAVSVGFMPVRMVSRWDHDQNGFQEECKALGVERDEDGRPGCNCIYLEQQQKELSACIIGANPNALARGYKAGLLNDADLDWISTERAKRETADSTVAAAGVEKARQRAREAFLGGWEAALRRL